MKFKREKRELVAQLKQLRKTKAVTQSEMAKRLGITQSAYSHLERGCYTTFDVIFRAFTALGSELVIEVTKKAKS